MRGILFRMLRLHASSVYVLFMFSVSTLLAVFRFLHGRA